MRVSWAPFTELGAVEFTQVDQIPPVNQPSHGREQLVIPGEVDSKEHASFLFCFGRSHPGTKLSLVLLC